MRRYGIYYGLCQTIALEIVEIFCLNFVKMSDMIKYRAVSFKKDQIAAMSDIVNLEPECKE